jgi:hypothetical protein
MLAAQLKGPCRIAGSPPDGCGGYRGPPLCSRRSGIGFEIAYVDAILAAIRREAPLRATQDGKVAGHIDSSLLADDMRLDRFQDEPMVFREPSKIRL